MSEQQAQKLDVKAYPQQSPYLEQCCLLLSANASYAQAAVDLQVLTGLAVSHSTQQRLAHRQSFESTVKQIGRRIKISGAQWEKDNVLQVLKQRTAYLNGQFSK